MGKIATEQDVYNVGKQGTPIANKCCTKERASVLGCTLTLSRNEHQLVMEGTYAATYSWFNFYNLANHSVFFSSAEMSSTYIKYCSLERGSSSTLLVCKFNLSPISSGGSEQIVIRTAEIFMNTTSINLSSDMLFVQWTANLGCTVSKKSANELLLVITLNRGLTGYCSFKATSNTGNKSIRCYLHFRYSTSA